MTQYNKATLATYFQQNDVPTGTDYANLIDSQINLVETSAQSMAGPLITTELITARLSATNANFVGNSYDINVAGSSTLALGGVYNWSIGGSFSAGLSNAFIVNAGGNVGFLGQNVTLSAGANLNLKSNGAVAITATNAAILNVGSSITLNAGTQFLASATASINFQSPIIVLQGAVQVSGGLQQNVGIVSAAGSAQATAAVLLYPVNRGKGVVDGQTTGFTPLANKAGLTQVLYNEGPSANLWPPTGGTINGLAANAVFPLAASAMVTIVALTASAYAVK